MRARIAASIVLAIALAVGATGCTFITPQDTTRITESSTGVSGNVGDISVRNAVIVSGNGAVGNLVTTLVNSGDQKVRVKVQRANGGREDSFFVSVPANTVTKIGSDGEQLVLFKKLHSMPGSLYPVYFQYGSHTGVRLLVPVLNGSLQQYQNLLPADLRPPLRPTPGATPTPALTPTPTATPAS